MAIGKLTGRLMRHIKKTKPIKAVPNQAKPPIPKKSFLKQNKGKLIGGGALVTSGALADTAAERAFGKGSNANNQGSVNVFVVQKRTNVRQSR